MKLTPDDQSNPSPEGESVRALFHQWMDAWNQRQPEAFAALFAEDGSAVGFDGSQMIGRAEIEAQIRQIFAHHQTARYVGLVREVRLLASNVALLRAVVGMAPPGQTALNPAVNAIQSLVAVKVSGEWRIALQQHTPAQFHGRPEMAEALTAELSRLL